MAELLDPEFVITLHNHRLGVNWLAFTPNSDYIASASDDKTIVLHSLNEKDQFFKFEGHRDQVTSVAVATDFMISGSKDCGARVWRLDNVEAGGVPNKDSTLYRCHAATVRSVDISPDEKTFCTASDDKTVKIWSATNSTKCVSLFSNQHTNWVRSAKFSKINDNYLASCGDDGVIIVWDLRTKDAAMNLGLKRRSTHFTAVQWNPVHDHLLASSSTDSACRIWDLRSGNAQQSYQIHSQCVTSIDFHESGKYAVTSSNDATSKFIDIFLGKNLFTCKSHTGQVNCAQFSPNGKLFATAGKDHTISVWKSNLPSSDMLDEDEDQMSIYDMPEIDNDETTPSSAASSVESVETKDEESVSNIPTDRISTLRSMDAHRDRSPPSELSPQCECIDFLKNILSQFSVLTDSIIELDTRLSQIEKRLSKLDK